ncbi:MAG: D-2-hydroxyacid dehydrogenase [Clostridia bacterium]|nr:D-2-hydroxyacid dehydrogenase [Clostridia bacterium]
MRIVVLDGYALNPGDLSWDKLNELGNVKIYDRTSLNEIEERAKGADILFTNKTPLNRGILEKLPELKYIGVLATGYNVVDIDEAKKRNIIVTNIPNYSTMSVAQMTFALLLELCYHAEQHSIAVKSGEWANSKDFCFWKHPLTELAGKTIGIIGFGNIGQKVADIATAFGMDVMAFSRTKNDQSHRTNFRWAELNELFAQSDVVSLHCPLFPETRGLINKETLKLMKSSAFLINTSRGPVIVEEDLAEALEKGIIAGAGIDVMSSEPPKADNPLFNTKNCIITPHVAWATKEARIRLMDIAANNLKAFIEGKPVNVVNQ